MTYSHSLSDETPDFQIISSLRFDPDLPTAVTRYTDRPYPEPHDSPYYLLKYHRDRLLKAAVEFNWRNAISFLQQDLASFTRVLDTFIPDRNTAWRLRIVVENEGRCSIDVHPAATWPLQCMFLPSSFDVHKSLSSTFPWQLVVDSQRTDPSPFTAHKTTSRNHYNAARERAGISSPMDPKEVLLVNPRGEVMEGSITTVYFRERIDGENNPQWVTPSLDSGGMVSASRMYALDQGFCTERVIRIKDLVDGEQCFLSNAVRGFIPAVLNLRSH